MESLIQLFSEPTTWVALAPLKAMEVGGDMFEGKPLENAVTMGFNAAIAQILLLDLVFSIDSIIAAVDSRLA